MSQDLAACSGAGPVAPEAKLGLRSHKAGVSAPFEKGHHTREGLSQGSEPPISGSEQAHAGPPPRRAVAETLGPERGSLADTKCPEI